MRRGKNSCRRRWRRRPSNTLESALATVRVAVAVVVVVIVVAVAVVVASVEGSVASTAAAYATHAAVDGEASSSPLSSSSSAAAARAEERNGAAFASADGTRRSVGGGLHPEDYGAGSEAEARARRLRGAKNRRRATGGGEGLRRERERPRGKNRNREHDRGHQQQQSQHEQKHQHQQKQKKKQEHQHQQKRGKTSKEHASSLSASSDKSLPSSPASSSPPHEYSYCADERSSRTHPRPVHHIHLSLGRPMAKAPSAATTTTAAGSTESSSVTVSFSSAPCVGDDGDIGGDETAVLAGVVLTSREREALVPYAEDAGLAFRAIAGGAGGGEKGEGVRITTERSSSDAWTGPFRYNATAIHGRLGRNGSGGSPSSPGLYFSDNLHHVEIHTLEPDTTYYYLCLAGYIPADAATESKFRRRRMRTSGEERGTEQRREDANDDDPKNDDDSIPKEGVAPAIQIALFATAPLPGSYPSSRRRVDVGGGDGVSGGSNNDGALIDGNDVRTTTTRSVKFAVLADLATLPHSRETIHALDEAYLNRRNDDDGGDLDMIILAGDLAYGNSDHSVWDRWFDALSSTAFFAELPTMVAAGNHDHDRDVATGEIFAAYENRFRMPRIRPAARLPVSDASLLRRNREPLDFLPYEYGNAYYSFVYGPVHHLVLSSYSDFRPGSAQHEWLEEELSRRVNRTTTPWLVVTMHCPIYNTFQDKHHEFNAGYAGEYLEPLFVDHRVNVVLTGHLHAYSRTKPVSHGNPDRRGPVHIVVGNAGRDANAPYLNPDEPEEWVEVRDHTTYGYGTLEVLNETMARWEWIGTGYDGDEEEGYSDEEWDLRERDEEENMTKAQLRSRGGELRDREYIWNQLFL